VCTTTHTDPTASAQTIALDQVDVGANVRDLDPEHVAALAASIALRGLVVLLAVRPAEEGRYELVAGAHRHAAEPRRRLERRAGSGRCALTETSHRRDRLWSYTATPSRRSTNR
jgi:hypothetical protein